MAKKAAKRARKAVRSTPARTSATAERRPAIDRIDPSQFKIPNYWSFSSWVVHDQCPRKYFFSRCAKRWDPGIKRMAPLYPDPPSPNMERGIRIHKLAEGFLLGEVRGVPKELQNFKRQFENLKMAGAAPEVSWTITSGGDLCEATDFSRAWLRAKVDAHVAEEEVVTTVDVKTGRVKPYLEQQEIYAVMAGFVYTAPSIKEYPVELWYTDHQPAQGENPQIEVFPAKPARTTLRKKWMDRGFRMLKDRKFEPKPGPACDAYGGCPFRSDRRMVNGKLGPCNAWRAA